MLLAFIKTKFSSQERRGKGIGGRGVCQLQNQRIISKTLSTSSINVYSPGGGGPVMASPSARRQNQASISLQALNVGNENMKKSQTVGNLLQFSETPNTNFHFILIWISHIITKNKGLNPFPIILLKGEKKKKGQSWGDQCFASTAQTTPLSSWLIYHHSFKKKLYWKCNTFCFPGNAGFAFPLLHRVREEKEQIHPKWSDSSQCY